MFLFLFIGRAREKLNQKRDRDPRLVKASHKSFCGTMRKLSTMLATTEGYCMQMYSQDYVSKLRAYQEELLQRLALLVNTDSGSGHTEGITRIMAYLESWLRELGFTVTLHPTEH